MTVSIIADSINSDGQRLTTFHLTDISERVLLDCRTHRVIHGFDALDWQAESWSVASSRLAGSGIDIIAETARNPLLPVPDGKWYRASTDTKMGRGEHFDERDSAEYTASWGPMAEFNATIAKQWRAHGMHPELYMALIRPFFRYRCVVSGTDWDGFFAQRAIPMDERHGPRMEVRALALDMQRAMQASTPIPVPWGGWHLPFVSEEEIGREDVVELSVSRCARATVGREGEGEAGLASWLLRQDPKHLGPFEHAAVAVPGRHANLTGWRSVRCSMEVG